MQCAQCQHENASDANFCDDCGTPLVRSCPNCGAENRSAARFCKLCGTSLTEPTLPLRPSQNVFPPLIQDVPTDRTESLSVDLPKPEAERRQLTVMFCDLVDSTVLASHLDPEELRDIVRAYQAMCTDVIQRFDGHVAQLLGDGLLVYLGYPHAHEDDAVRAVRAGLAMLESMETLNTDLQQERRGALAVRIGIHTGLVVVGEMGGKGRQEQLALGDTPNVASRLQELAEPDTVVISHSTYRLIEGYFTCRTLGSHALKGVAQPMPVYRVLHESDAQTRFEVEAMRGFTPLVGREDEVALLLRRWRLSGGGQGQVVLLSTHCSKATRLFYADLGLFKSGPNGPESGAIPRRGKQQQFRPAGWFGSNLAMSFRLR